MIERTGNYFGTCKSKSGPGGKKGTFTAGQFLVRRKATILFHRDCPLPTGEHRSARNHGLFLLPSSDPDGLCAVTETTTREDLRKSLALLSPIQTEREAQKGKRGAIRGTQPAPLPRTGSQVPPLPCRSPNRTGRSNRTGGLVTRWREALERSSEDTTHLMGQRTRGGTSDWTGTVPEQNSLGQCYEGAAPQAGAGPIQATSLRPKQQFLRTSVCSVHEGGARTVPRGVAFPKGTALANHESNRNDRQIPRGWIPTAGVRWLRMTGHFKCPWEGSILSSLDPWFYWSWTVWPLWLSTHQSGPASLKPGVFLSNT